GTARAPPPRPVGALRLDVSDGHGIRPGADRVLAVVDDVDLDAEVGLEAGDEGGDGPVALAGDGAVLAVHHELGPPPGPALARRRLVRQELHARVLGHVLGHERVPQLAWGDLRTGVLRDALDRLGELDLQAPGQLVAVLGRHDVGDAALARLAVDPDDRLVGAADVLRVDGQVRHAPGLVVGP